MVNQASSAWKFACLGVVLTGLLFGVCTAPAHAAAPTASGKAFDFSIQISVAGINVLNQAPVDQVQFTDMSAPYNNVMQTGSFDSGPGLARLQTGSLVAETEWIPTNSFLAVGSRATANDVNLSVVDVTAVSLLSLQANQIQSTSIVTGTCPPSIMQLLVANIVDDYIFRNGFEVVNLLPSSTAKLPGLGITVLGTSLASLPTDPPPNTSITLPVGESLVLNEQVVSGDGITSLSVTSNALHLVLNMAGIITSDIPTS